MVCASKSTMVAAAPRSVIIFWPLYMYLMEGTPVMAAVDP